MNRAERRAHLEKTATTGNHQQVSQSGTHSSNDERRISGVVRIAGEIKADLPPNLVKEYISSSGKTDAREDKRFIAELVTVALLLIVAVLNFVQSRAAVQSAKYARLDESPWMNFVRINTVTDPNGSGIERYDVTLKNFGHSPAFQVKAVSVFSTFKPPKFAPAKETAKGYVTYAPDQENYLYLGTTIPAETVRMMHSGEISAYMQIGLWYTDYWGVEHADKFCEFYDVRTQTWVGRQPDTCDD